MFKNEMQKTIQEQNEKIIRLEKAFRDVTGAYKTLLSEKEALQKSVKLLSEASACKTSEKLVAGGTGGLQTTDIVSSADQALSEYEDKIGVLTNNIQILIEAKSKLESGFQGERKKFRNDYEELRNKYDDSQKALEDLSADNRELKLSLRQIQMEKEKILQENTSISEKLKKKTTDEAVSEDNTTPKVVNLDQIQKEYKELVSILRSDNDELKQKLKILNEKLTQPSDEVVKLEKEISLLKNIYEKRISDESNRIGQTELKFRETIEKNEKRTAALETEITELYRMIASYENKKTNDSASGSHLPHKEASLMSIPTQTMLATALTSEDFNNPNYSQSEEIEKAIQRIYELKNLIETNATGLNLNLSDIWKQFSHKTDFDDEKMHERCRDEYKNLRDEFERFKLKSNQLMKAKQPKDSLVSNEVNVQQLKDENEFLRTRLNTLDKTKASEQDRYEEKLKNLEANVQKIKNEQKLEVEQLEQRYSLNITELEEQLKKQRDRTLKLIAEKDAEIERLRINGDYSTQNSAIGAAGGASSADEPAFQRRQSSNKGIQMKDDSHQAPQIAPIAETTLLHYSHELAFKDAEISKLRRVRSDLENRIKEILIENQIECDNYRMQIDLLKKECERLKLNSAREQQSSANMEYIKNVVFRFLTTKDQNVRLGMIHAITQILKFTRQEKTQVLTFYEKNNMFVKK